MLFLGCHPAALQIHSNDRKMEWWLCSPTVKTLSHNTRGAFISYLLSKGWCSLCPMVVLHIEMVIHANLSYWGLTQPVSTAVLLWWKSCVRARQQVMSKFCQTLATCSAFSLPCFTKVCFSLWVFRAMSRDNILHFIFTLDWNTSSFCHH